MDTDIYRLRAKLKTYQYKVNKAIGIIQRAIATTDKWYVSSSWGKDSICVVDMVRRIQPDIEVVFIDSGCQISLLDCDKVIVDEYVQREQINLVHLEWDKMAYYLSQVETSDHKSILYQTMFAPLNDWLADNPHDGVFLGLRKDESAVRYRSISKYGALHQYKTGSQKDTWRCLPIYDWSIYDVATYVIDNNLPILDIYKKLGFSARSGMFGYGSAQYGRFVYLKRYYPDIFNRYAAMFPDIRTYT